MSKTRDLCWLIKKVHQPDISGYHIKDKKDSIVMKTIERELTLLFEGAEPSDDPGSSWCCHWQVLVAVMDMR